MESTRHVFNSCSMSTYFLQLDLESGLNNTVKNTYTKGYLSKYSALPQMRLSTSTVGVVQRRRESVLRETIRDT